MTDNIVFSGSLLFLPLADVFQLLGGNNCSGKLTLQTQYSPDTGFVYFIHGNPIKAFWGKLKGIDAVYGLFGWTEGKYEFTEEDLSGVEPDITQSLMEIVLDSLRLMDDGQIAKLGPTADQKESEKKAPEGAMPAIKGPLVDYLYVKREDYYPDGSPIVNEGEYGKWLWVIYEGTVKIVKDTPKGPLTLARLGDGCFIGTIGSLLRGEYKRNASAIAEGNAQLCILDVEALTQEFFGLSQDFRKILLSLDNRLRQVNEHAVRVFTGEPNPEFPPDKVRDEKYHSSTDVFIIREGTADIIGKGPKGDVHLLSLGKDDIFGKIPFMSFNHEPLAAAVLTSPDFQADALNSQALQKEYDKLSHTFRNFVFNTSTHISMTTRLFYQLVEKAIKDRTDHTGRPSPEGAEE